jgi:hypothetical protein
MRKWYVPLTVLGLGGLGVLFGTERGRRALRRASDLFEAAPEQLAAWNNTIEQEMANIQEAVDSIASVIAPDPTRAR